VPREEIDPNLSGVPEEIVIGNEKVLLQYELSHDCRYAVYPEVKAYKLW
jgi:hypothetical protein